MSESPPTASSPLNGSQLTSSAKAVPSLSVPSANTATAASMRMFTPRQQPSSSSSAGHPRSQRTGRPAGQRTAAHVTDDHTARDGVIPSASRTDTSAATPSIVPAKKAKANASGGTPAQANGKLADAIPSTVPSSSAASGATHSHRSGTTAPATAAASAPASQPGEGRPSYHHTPRLTQKAPPSSTFAGPTFSAPPHAKHLRSAAPVTTASSAHRAAYGPANGTRSSLVSEDGGGGVAARASTSSHHATNATSTAIQGTDYVRPPARTAATTTMSVSARPTPLGGSRLSTSGASSAVRGTSEGSVSPAPHHADPAVQPQTQERLSSAPVVRGAPTPVAVDTAADAPQRGGSGANHGHDLRVHVPQQATHPNTASSGSSPTTVTTGAAQPAAGTGSRPTARGAPSSASTHGKASPVSSRRAIPSRSAVALAGGGNASAVRPVGSARAGSAAASGQAMQMADLVRPSEAYKVKLTPTVQQRTVARRSRQPRKIVNTFLSKYPVVRRVAEALGFDIEESEDELNAYQFNLCWSDTVLPLVRLVRLGNWQRTNHFPSMYLLCRKLHLATTLGRMQRRLPQHFHFSPMTWSMRSERGQLIRYINALKQKRLVKYFIVKPNAGCQGRGIQVTRDPIGCVEDPDNYIAQEYIPRPLLLENRKFDLRVYVLLTSIREPSIFMFNDGLVRMCAEVYDVPTDANIKNTCKHLTNYAVNKRSPEFVYNTDAARGDVGNKRNFRFFNRWLTEMGESPQIFWEKVGFVIVKTILAAQPHISMVYNSCFPRFNEGHTCFEVLGFDILVDHKMKPWLMEVNHTPSFATDTPLDNEIKTGVLMEAWDIVDCKATDYERDRQRERHDFAMRNMRTSTGLMNSARLRRPAGMANAYSETTSPPENDEQAELQARLADEQLLANRMREDSKLKNYTRIFPTDVPEYDDVYRTIRQLAEAEAAMRATNGSLFVNGVNGPVLSVNATGTTASPVSASSPSVADTYRFPGPRDGSPHGGGVGGASHHVRTTSTVSTSASGDYLGRAAGGLASVPVSSTAAASITSSATATSAAAAATANGPPKVVPAEPVAAAPSPQAESYKKLEEEMLRVRRRASQDAASQRTAASHPRTPNSEMTASHDAKPATRTTQLPAHTPEKAGCEQTAASAGTDQRNDMTRSLTPNGAGGRSTLTTSLSTAAASKAPLKSATPLKSEKKAPSQARDGAALNTTTRSASHDVTLTSAVPLTDSTTSKNGHSSHRSSSHNTPSRGAKKSGTPSPTHGPSKAPSSVVAKDVSPEDLRRLASLQEQLEREEEAEPENHDTDESFDLDE